MILRAFRKIVLALQLVQNEVREILDDFVNDFERIQKLLFSLQLINNSKSGRLSLIFSPALYLAILYFVWWCIRCHFILLHRPENIFSQGGFSSIFIPTNNFGQ